MTLTDGNDEALVIARHNIGINAFMLREDVSGERYRNDAAAGEISLAALSWGDDQTIEHVASIAPAAVAGEHANSYDVVLGRSS